MSVAHILKTAFKEEFDEQNRRKGAIEARELDKIIQEKKRLLAEEAEREAARRKEEYERLVAEKEAARAKAKG